MENLNLGQIIRGDQHRDAVHIAVAPVTAAHRLAPATHVGFVGDGIVGSAADTIIGVIDPFLDGAVLKGEQCWLFLYPGSITSLRHDWSHPAFSVAVSVPSEEWIRNLAHARGFSYEDIITAGRTGALPTDGYIDDVPIEFWAHWEAVTGLVARERVAHFSCSC